MHVLLTQTQSNVKDYKGNTVTSTSGTIGYLMCTMSAADVVLAYPSFSPTAGQTYLICRFSGNEGIPCSTGQVDWKKMYSNKDRK